MRDQFLAVLAESMYCDRAIINRTGVTVVASPARATSHVSSGYRLGEHFVVGCDPAAERLLTAAVADMAPTLEAWQVVAREAGGELLGSSRMQLLPSELPLIGDVPEGYTLRQLNCENADDVAMIARLIERSDADDLDEAEIELDVLDETILVLLDVDGEIAAYSSARPFDLAPEFGDIGIFTSADCRGRGLGAFLVAALCPLLREADLEPLYRCSDDNVASVHLSAALGFEIATQLVGYRFQVD